MTVDFSALDACVHCGFCLPACPTYTRLGDEADSPRGRLHLMRAVAEGRLDSDSHAFHTHLDRCLGCRACEPVCPSGVRYGALLEQARAVARERRPSDPLTRVLLRVFGSLSAGRGPLVLARLLRSVGLAGLLRRVLPRGGRIGAARRGLAMLAGSRPWRAARFGAGLSAPTGPFPSRLGSDGSVEARRDASDTPGPSDRVAVEGVAVVLLRGCVQRGLFARVQHATASVLRANGHDVRTAEDQGCCGALHAHAGDLEGARRLARRNIAAFMASSIEAIVVDAAGCGAAMKEYADWLKDDPDWADRARVVSRRTWDVTEFLVRSEIRSGAALSGSVALHPPCHLEHAQGVTAAPERVLRAIPELRIERAERATECCGGAGIYGLTHPEMGDRIGRDKAEALVATGASCVATGNPGCMMQIAAHLDELGAGIDVAHPVELLYESYRRAGLVAD